MMAAIGVSCGAVPFVFAKLMASRIQALSLSSIMAA
ncbi:hypothetical protein L284_17400 [Novosphingobium lindaniclasticum LE124]|uniref:Uncharacterized protein n=1 Tax=Novosphingobium lindaniclasticum LE124 TaxID=1096930 RepID=T0IL16_9SPHN|nr:hypothetical protein L284_17400 [Novosphingobium lindaniclasticum LE124]